MVARNFRSRLGLEQLEDRCTPSAFLGNPWAPVPARHGGPDATAARVRATREHAIPIKLAYQCSADISTGNASASGFATHLGHWTGQGRLDSGHVDPVADRASISGTLTVVTAKGDKLFVTFSSSWQLSTGKGTESITVTGGTGRFAGASGHTNLDCTISADPTSPTTFRCNCVGTGILLLPR